MNANRRVKGLRREEVAALAGISVEYYIRLERGDARGVSENVLLSVSRALRLDESEHAHLLDLIRSGGGIRPCRLVAPATEPRPSMRRILDSMTTTPALILDGHLDVIGANALGRALYQPMYGPRGNANVARFVFADPAACTFWCDWDTIADDTANTLRAESGRNPCDRSVTELVDELAARSPEFTTRWACHDVHVRSTGTRRIEHPLVGRLTLPLRVHAPRRRPRPDAAHVQRRHGLGLAGRTPPNGQLDDIPSPSCVVARHARIRVHDGFMRRTRQ
ncbi:helix-turn-helix domain-containing protein [Streptomyces tauricus]|uniref:helix-turn-helix domain-containing protein n=1 Tax=Streptomyces tauricus TaxID=68274 RepID=UPI00343BC2FF